MLLYFTPEHVFNKDFRGPDFFVVKGVEHDKKWLSYVAWQENSRLPCVIIELGSESTLKIDRGPKKKLYAETLRTEEYFIYDPIEPRLEGWRLNSGAGYAPLELEPGNRMWSKGLELYVGPWEGEYLFRRERWLRFFDVRGNPIPTTTEAATTARAEAEARAKAETTARVEAEDKAKAEAAARTAAETEIHRLKQELEALRKQLPLTLSPGWPTCGCDSSRL